MKVYVAVFLFCLAGAAVAQPITIGPNYGPTIGSSGDVTAIDLTYGATNNGNITSVRFDWAATPCVGDVKIKFVRRSGGQLTVFAERGPFNGSQTNTAVAITPVAVLAGDFIGITQLLSPGCGNSTVSASVPAAPGYITYSSDVTGTFNVSAGTMHPTGTLNVMGTGTATLGAAVPALSRPLLAALVLAFAVIGAVVLKR
jgi:hypothetical protein